MFRLVGLLCFTLGMGLIGVLKSIKLKEREKLLEDFLQIVLMLKGEINYFREPLTSLFKKISKNGDTKGFQLLSNILYEITEKDAEIAQIWPEITNYTYKDTPLKNEDIEIIKFLGTFIGQTDYENQISQFNYIEKKLNAAIEDAKSCYRIKGPLYRRLGFFIGAIISIVFL